MIAPLRSARAVAARNLRVLLRPNPAYLDWKFRDLQGLTGFVMAAFGVVGIGLWGWDFVVDAAGAPVTLPLRLTFLALIGIGWSIVRGRDRRPLQYLTVVLLAIMPVVFLAITTHLRGGMVYGIAGFLYFQLASVCLHCFSLRLNALAAIAAAATPPLAALAGLAPGFQHLHYAVLIWPAVGATLIAQIAMAYSHLQRYRLEQQLEAASNTDVLTGVSNRRHFVSTAMVEMARARREGAPLALLVIDLDHFKTVNDQYGHVAGDQVLRMVGGVCRDRSRPTDVVARLGGEEFAILLPGAGVAEASVVAEQVRLAIADTPVPVGGDVSVVATASIGVSVFASDDGDYQPMLARADTALYRAKRLGRNQVRMEADTPGVSRWRTPASLRRIVGDVSMS